MMSDGPIFQTDQITPADGEVEIIELKAEPYPDSNRIKVTFRLSYFAVPPNAAISVADQDGETLTSVDLVNIIHSENEVTLHLPKSRTRSAADQVKMTLIKLDEREAEEDEQGEVKLTSQVLSTRSVPISLP